ncbi:MAG: peptidoglycan-binding protein [Propionibacteriales bacterium]|nr:peptidoglycan-binding protein [Propionibacteriales bacterium]
MTTSTSPRSISRPVALLLSAVLAVGALVTGAVNAAGAAASTTENTFVSRINNTRANHGVGRLAVRDALVEVAREQARRMADRNVLYHNPNLTTDVRNWQLVGENVGYGGDARSLHKAFMASPGHRANILERDYTQVGIGAVVRDGRLWVAEVFRRPLRSVVTWTHTLRVGSTGKAVTRVQHRLDVRASGHYGRATKRAVRHFQVRQGWDGSGKVGLKTWSRLF